MCCRVRDACAIFQPISGPNSSSKANGHLGSPVATSNGVGPAGQNVVKTGGVVSFALNGHRENGCVDSRRKYARKILNEFTPLISIA
jgi:hypothetical protein